MKLNNIFLISHGLVGINAILSESIYDSIQFDSIRLDSKFLSINDDLRHAHIHFDPFFARVQSNVRLKLNHFNVKIHFFVETSSYVYSFLNKYHIDGILNDGLAIRNS